MTSRALISIGCNAYDHLTPLTGAEADATDLFETLIKPDVGDYDRARSQLLLSPTLSEVREALAAILFETGQLDALTIVFAGHGAVNGGSFYMATRDSRLQGLSATALSLADLLRMIAEAAPKQTYIFIDSCQSGGLISDLNVILKSEVMGDFGTPGVTLLATAASNQEAFEFGGQGIGTAALLECIHGGIFLQDSNPALDLVEIGRAVSDRVAAKGAQTPVVWGLNLYGPASFCKNPHASTGNSPLRKVLVGWTDSQSSAAIRTGLPRLWEPYVAIPTRWNPRAFIDQLSPVLANLRSDPLTLIDFTRRIADAFSIQARLSPDHFREIELKAACAVAMLPFADDPMIARFVSSYCAEIGSLVEQAVAEVNNAVDRYRFALVTGAMSDLYYLPLRLSRLLGWASYAVHARLLTGREAEISASTLADLFARFVETYSLSLVAMSDEQAPYVMSFLTAAAKIGLREEGELLLGHMFSSVVDCGGQIARGRLDPSKVLEFLIARSARSKQNPDVIAQPTELVIALLRGARLFDVGDVFDVYLEALDHLPLNAYLPDDYRRFGEETIDGGVNAVFWIGQDVWCVADMEAAWPNFPRPENEGIALASLLSSLLFPDRAPWFLLATPSLIEADVDIVTV